MTLSKPKKCRKKATRARPEISDMTLHNMIQELFEGLEDEVMKRIPLIYTFDDVERFQSMLCNDCCYERRPKFDFIDDYTEFAEGDWLNKNNRVVDKETIERAMRMASLYVTLCILVKYKASKRRDYGF